MPDIYRLHVMQPRDIETMGYPYSPVYHPEMGRLDWVKEVNADRYRLVTSGKECLLIIGAEKLNELDTRVHSRQEEPLDFWIHSENRIYEFVWISTLEASEVI